MMTLYECPIVSREGLVMYQCDVVQNVIFLALQTSKCAHEHERYMNLIKDSVTVRIWVHVSCMDLSKSNALSLMRLAIAYTKSVWETERN